MMGFFMLKHDEFLYKNDDRIQTQEGTPGPDSAKIKPPMGPNGKTTILEESSHPSHPSHPSICLACPAPCDFIVSGLLAINMFPREIVPDGGEEAEAGAISIEES